MNDPGTGPQDELASGIADHYTRGRDTLASILAAFDAAGIEELTVDVLGGVDEFHLGGRAATDELIGLLALRGGERVLDVGCGIGGPARTMAAHADVTVLGVDLTPSFVDAATALSERVGLGASTSFEVTDVRALHTNESFDVATMLHVGMNVPDKLELFESVARALAPGGRFVVYDIMRTADEELRYPLPWASTPEQSFVEEPQHYESALSAAGFLIEQQRNFTELVLDAVRQAATTPPPVNLTHLVGPEFATMFGNLVPAITSGALAPTTIVARLAHSPDA